MSRPSRRIPPTHLLALLLLASAIALGLSACGASRHRHATTATATAPSPTRTVTGTTSAGAPAAGGPVTYGIGDAIGQFARCAPGHPDCCSPQAVRCTLADTQGYYDDPRFLALLSPSSAHRIADVRLFVPYDAVQTWNGSASAPGCVFSRVRDQSWYDLANGQTPAGAAIDDLLAGVIEARADGLTPIVSISGYVYPTARPPWDAAFPDPTTTAGYWDYRCGLQGILDELSRLPAWAQPHVWEALNEPETFPIFVGSRAAPAGECAVGTDPQPDGPAKAACVQAIAAAEIHGFADHAGDTLLAGTFEHPYAGYLAPYVSELAVQMPGAAFPTAWSVHDYRDVTGSYDGTSTPLLAGFDAALARDTGGRARSLWISESGAVLTSAVRAGDCPAAGIDPAGSLGACLNGQPPRQTASATAFFALPHAAHAVPVTHLFWYQFTGARGWDSGLLAPDGQPRVAYCVFYGHGLCSGDPNAA